MNDIIKLSTISNHKYSHKIDINKYTQSFNKKKEEIYSSRYFIYIILNIFNPLYNLSSKKEKKVILINEKCEIASNIINLDLYDKSFTIQIIKNGLLNLNNLSSLFYLTDYYKNNIIIIDKNYYYQSSYKYDNNIFIKYNNNNFYQLNDIDISNYSLLPTNILYNIFTNNLISNKIYKLKSINSYKLDELKKIAVSYKIDIHPSMKKRDIYDLIFNRIII